MREKYLIFTIRDYSKTKMKEVFAEYKNLPEDFFEVLDESPFFLRNFLCQNFLFNYITLLEGYNYYPYNSYSVLNKINCIQEFQLNEEICKKKMNFEGMIKSLCWMLIHSFHEILDAISNEYFEKTLLLQKFCFYYKILLKNYNHWGFHINKLIPENYQNMIDFFFQDKSELAKRPEFQFLEEENEALLIIVIIMHLKWDGTEKNEISDFKEVLKFSENKFQKVLDESRFALLDSEETFKKMVMLLILMKQLDQMEIEYVMDQNFFVFEDKLCVKVVEFLIESWNNIKKILKSYQKK